MHDALQAAFNETDIVIMAGAPADYRPREFTPHKIKKTTETLTLPLERNPDIAQTLGERKTHQTLVCFAAETNDLLENAKKKLIRKNCDLIVANDVLEEGAGFQSDTNIVTLLDRDGTCEQLPRSSKRRRSRCHSDKNQFLYETIPTNNPPTKMNHQQIRAFFALNHTRPKKQLGQNFLVNPEALKIILEAGALTAHDTVIEIGAGLGCLTDAVVGDVERIIAVEVDELLYNALVAQFSTNSRVQLLNADILKMEFDSLLSVRHRDSASYI